MAADLGGEQTLTDRAQISAPPLPTFDGHPVECIELLRLHFQQRRAYRVVRIPVQHLHGRPHLSRDLARGRGGWRGLGLTHLWSAAIKLAVRRSGRRGAPPAPSGPLAWCCQGWRRRYQQSLSKNCAHLRQALLDRGGVCQVDGKPFRCDAWGRTAGGGPEVACDSGRRATAATPRAPAPSCIERPWSVLPRAVCRPGLASPPIPSTPAAPPAARSSASPAASRSGRRASSATSKPPRPKRRAVAALMPVTPNPAIAAMRRREAGGGGGGGAGGACGRCGACGDGGIATALAAAPPGIAAMELRLRSRSPQERLVAGRGSLAPGTRSTRDHRRIGARMMRVRSDKAFIAVKDNT
jgi:hypothetical protein